MKVKNEAQFARLTAPDIPEPAVADVLTKLVLAVSEQSTQMRAALTEQAKALNTIGELTVTSRVQGPIAVTVEAPQGRPRQWVAVVERDRRDLMSRVVITSIEEGE